MERLSSLALMHSHPSRLKLIKYEDILNKFLSATGADFIMEERVVTLFLFLKTVDFKIEYLLNLQENNLNVQILQIFQILSKIFKMILSSKIIVNVITIRCFF